MTDDDKIIALAEYRGFKPEQNFYKGKTVWAWPEGFPTVSSRPYAELHELPRYLHSLDEMRGLITSLPVEGKTSQKAMRFWMWEVSGQMTVLPSAREYVDGFLMMLGKIP